MKFTALLLSLIMLLTISACAKRSPEAQKQEAEAEYIQEKTDTLKNYKACVEKSGGDANKMKQCDALLKAVHAVEGTQPAPAAQTAPPTQAAPPGQ